MHLPRERNRNPGNSFALWAGRLSGSLSTEGRSLAHGLVGRKRMRKQSILASVIGAGLLTATASADPYNPSERAIGGGLLGAGTGAVIGAIAGGGHGAGIGAAVGGGLGAVAGAATTPARPHHRYHHRTAHRYY
jgi:hypothetical protein